MAKLRIPRSALYIAAGVAVLLIAYYAVLPHFRGGCHEAGTVKLEYFFSETCPACADQKPILAQLEAEFGDSLDVKRRCVKIHQGDDALCTEKYGKEPYDYAMLRAKEIGLSATPTIVIDCGKTLVGVHSAEGLKKEICKLLGNNPSC